MSENINVFVEVVQEMKRWHNQLVLVGRWSTCVIAKRSLAMICAGRQKYGKTAGARAARGDLRWEYACAFSPVFNLLLIKKKKPTKLVFKMLELY